jgi:hypothetical protein
MYSGDNSNLRYWPTSTLEVLKILNHRHHALYERQIVKVKVFPFLYKDEQRFLGANFQEDTFFHLGA